MIAILEKRPILTIIIVVGLMLLPFLDVMEVTIMEARNFISAREMLTDDHWVLTTMNGEPRYQKPPLPTWLTAVSAMVFGIQSLWGLRLPAVLMVMLLGVILYLLSRKLLQNKSHALVNSLVGVSSIYVLLIVFEAPWDIFTHAFMLTAIYCLTHIFQSLKTDWRWVVAAIVFLAAAVLSKGPVSVYVLLLPFLLAYGFVFKDGAFKRKWFALAIAVLFGLSLGFSWYLYVRLADPETFKVITAKETGNWTSYNVRPFYYYWSFFTQSGLWTIPAFISLLYPYLKSRVSNLKVYQFTLLWTILAVVLLSIIPEKKSRYLMPVLIPLAMNIGFYLEYLIRRFKELKDKRETFPVWFNFGLLGFVFMLVLPGVLFVINESSVDYGMEWWMFIPWILCLLTGVSLLRNLMNKRVKKVIFFSIIGLVLVVNSLLAVRSQNHENGDFNDFSNVTLSTKIPFYNFQMNSPELFWASGGKMKMIQTPSDKPEEVEFYLMICGNCENGLATYFPEYSYTFIDTININFAPPGTKEHKDRKFAKIFKLTLK